jgi:hypothetical protein
MNDTISNIQISKNFFKVFYMKKGIQRISIRFFYYIFPHFEIHEKLLNKDKKIAKSLERKLGFKNFSNFLV